MKPCLIHSNLNHKSALSEQSRISAVLTFTCPFVGGSAVYKARILNTYFNPLTQYNDRLGCLQSASQNKNTANGYVNIDSLYELEASITGAIISGNLHTISLPYGSIQTSDAEMDNIQIYPNPANDYVNIMNLNQSGEFNLLNPLGQIVYRTQLSEVSDLHHIQLPGLAAGVYNLQLTLKDKQYFNKLTIIK